MVANGMDVADVLKNIERLVGNRRDLAMFDDVQTLECTAKLQGEALKAQTDPEDGDEVVAVQRPQVTNKANVLRNTWRSGTWPNDDSREVAEIWAKFVQR